LFVVAAHFDRGALLAGELKLLQPVYQGPKAFLYFHFLWLVLAVGGAGEFARRRYGGAVLGVWAVPVVVLGAGFAMRLAQWPAVWTAAADVAIAEKITGGDVSLLGSRPSEEKLWKQLLKYTNSEARLGGTAEGLYVIARHRYSARGMEIQTAPLRANLCASPLAMSNGFVLCGSVPGFARTEFRLRGRLQSWDADWQPLVTCGVSGDAVFVGMKKDGDAKAILTIDEWGIPTVFGEAFPIQVGEPFELLVRLGREDGEVSAAHGGGAKVFQKLVSKVKLETCEAAIGRNDIGATTVSKLFHGEITDTLAPRQ
jgi:hypothetical protein